jgi:hypothetical protein
MSIVSAVALFTPGDTRRALDIYVQVSLFAKVRRAQQIVVDEAKSICPIRTGELAESIHAVEPEIADNQIVGRIVADAPHAAFVELGTGLRGAGTYPGPLPQQGVPITGSWVYDYRNQGWPGMPSQPYMRPALDLARSAVLAELQG